MIQQWKFLLVGVLVLCASMVHAATAQTIGGTLNTQGDLRIQYNITGTMSINRHNGSNYISQNLGKGSLLYANGSAYRLGYYNGSTGGVTPTLTSLTSTTSGGTHRIVAIWTCGPFKYAHTVSYVPGDAYYRSQWSVTNTSGSTVNDLRFFHGQDTFLAGSDNGSGFWVAGNNTVGVQQINGGIIQRQLLQGLTSVHAYESQDYFNVRSLVNAYALTNTIDGNQNTDNGYALEWRQASLAAGATWIIKGSEKFYVANSGGLIVTAPTVFDAIPNTTIQIPFVVQNTTGATISTTNLAIASSTGGWTASIASPSTPVSIAAGASQTVLVDVVVPAGAVPGDRSNITLTADDNAAFTISDISVAVVPNSPPTVPVDSNATANGVPENPSNGTVVGVTASSTDSDTSQTLVYSLTNNVGGRFAIDSSTGVVTVANGTLLNFESASSHTISVEVNDGIDSAFADFAIAVSNVNEVPTNIALAGSTVVENSANGTVVGTLSTTDIDAGDTFTYTLVSGSGDTNNAAFSIAGDQLKVAGPIDFEATATLSIRVRSTDAGSLNYEKSFTITVTDVVENLAPTNITLSSSTVAENSAAGTMVGTLASVDGDVADTHTYALVSGAGSSDNASFSIAGNALKAAVAFDFEAKASYSIRVKTTDSGVGNMTFEKVLTITVANENEAPILTSIAASPTTLFTGDTVNFTVAAIDPDGTVPTLSIDYGDGSSGSQLTHVYANKGTYTVTITVTDGALSDSDTLSLIVASADFNTDGFVGPMDKDSDADGVPDAMEVVMGTDPNNRDDSPLNGAKPISFRMEKPKATFGNELNDKIEFKGVLHVPAGLDPVGETLVIDGGGNVRKVELDEKARFKSDDVSFQLVAKLNLTKAKEARFKLVIGGALLDNMVKNAPKDEAGRPTQLSAHILFNGALLVQTKKLLYRN